MRLVHSVAPHAAPQRAAVWHHSKLHVAHGFEIAFEVQFHRPSTCVRPASSIGGGKANALKDVGHADAEERPHWQRRLTGCGDGPGSGGGSMQEGAIGGEGIALVVHNDPKALEARGCAGTGVGYAYDSSFFGLCRDYIRNSRTCNKTLEPSARGLTYADV